MNKEYPFWKLLRAQWSWKNDRVMLIINLISGFFVSCVNLLLMEVTYTETGLPVEGSDLTILILVSTFVLGLFMTLVYQLIKLSLLSLLCGLLCYGLNNNKWSGEDYYEMVERYEEMLTWRQ